MLDITLGVVSQMSASLRGPRRASAWDETGIPCVWVVLVYTKRAGHRFPLFSPPPLVDESAPGEGGRRTRNAYVIHSLMPERMDSELRILEVFSNSLPRGEISGSKHMMALGVIKLSAIIRHLAVDQVLISPSKEIPPPFRIEEHV